VLLRATSVTHKSTQAKLDSVLCLHSVSLSEDGHSLVRKRIND